MPKEVHDRKPDFFYKRTNASNTTLKAAPFSERITINEMDSNLIEPSQRKKSYYKGFEETTKDCLFKSLKQFKRSI